MLILASAFVGLMIDIRVEHVDVVRERSVAWLPIIYAAFMTFACLAACVFWKRRTRILMFPLFSAALVIGGLGFYFHNDGNVKRVLTTSAAAWTDPHLNHSDAPPQLAPLAFAGLGAVGVLVLLERFNS
jgi:hypothetical protein